MTPQRLLLALPAIFVPLFVVQACALGELAKECRSQKLLTLKSENSKKEACDRKMDSSNRFSVKKRCFFMRLMPGGQLVRKIFGRGGRYTKKSESPKSRRLCRPKRTEKSRDIAKRIAQIDSALIVGPRKNFSGGLRKLKISVEVWGGTFAGFL